MEISKNSTFLDIVTAYPGTREYFRELGFAGVSDEGSLAGVGSTLTVETAAMLKGMDSLDLVQGIQRAAGMEITPEEKTQGDYQVTGLLPCPVRIPLLEACEAFGEDFRGRTGRGISYNLQAAYVGLDWLKEDLDRGAGLEGLPDVFLSAGFDLFFHNSRLTQLLDRGAVGNPLAGQELDPGNEETRRAGILDTRGRYGVIGVVPAVFMVNTELLDGRDVPRSWEDVLSPEFADSVSLPVGDFDLFNGLLLNIYKLYGDSGLQALGRNMQSSMHPAQMVKSPPAVTILPYFFTRTIQPGSPVQAVWPREGAIVTPIFMLGTLGDPGVKGICEFLADRTVGEILSHRGRFPSTHSGVDNRLESGDRFLWLGWDYLYSQDVGALTRHAEGVFYAAARETGV